MYLLQIVSRKVESSPIQLSGIISVSVSIIIMIIMIIIIITIIILIIIILIKIIKIMFLLKKVSNNAVL